MKLTLVQLRFTITYLLLSLFLLSIARLLFLANNFTHFEVFNVFELVKSLLHGIRFDLSASLISLSPFVLFRLLPLPFFKAKLFRVGLMCYFIISNALMLLANTIDSEYFKFTRKRSTIDLFELAFLGDDIFILAPQFLIDFWYLFLIWFLMVLLMIVAYRTLQKKELKQLIRIRFSPSAYLWKTAVLIVTMPLIVIGVRGGLQGRIINTASASQFNLPELNILTLNTPFTMIQTYGKEDLAKASYFKTTEAEKLANLHHYSYEDGKPFDSKNVVILIIESLSKEYIGSLNNSVNSCTPFLDSLINYSSVYENAFANGTKSIEGVPAILASMPTLMNNSFITSHFIQNSFHSLPNLLKRKGYSSSFFHGGTNGTMGFDHFCRAAGFEEYYGRWEYGNESDYDGHWGIFDEPFLQYSLNKMDEFNGPFLSTIFTLSSHHPYKIPKKYETKFQQDFHPFDRVLKYTDYSLRKFFEESKHREWYKNTLFVITADHSWITRKPFYRTSVGSLSIPIIFFDPSNSISNRINKTVQQIDIMPSILSYLHYDATFFSFGKDFTKQGTNNAAYSYIGNNYQIIKGQYVLRFDGEKSISLYNYQTDSTLKQNLVNKEIHIQDSLEQELKAYIQVYNNRMIDNRLTN